MAPSSNDDLLGEEPLRRWDIRLIGIAYLILMVQNTLSAIFVGIYIIGIFPIDLIGFLLLAGGYLLYSTQEVEHKRYYFLGGLCMLGWAICRVLYQYMIPFLFMPQLIQTCPMISQPIDVLFSFINFFRGEWGVRYGIIQGGCSDLPLWRISMTISIFIGGLALALGSIVIWRTQKGNWGQKRFMLYGICNAIVISLFVVTGFPSPPSILSSGAHIYTVVALYSLKGFVVPLLGVIAFYTLWEGSKSALPPITSRSEA